MSTKNLEEKNKERTRNKKQGPSGVLHSRQAKEAKLEEQARGKLPLFGEEVGPVEYRLPATSSNAFVTLVS